MSFIIEFFKQTDTTPCDESWKIKKYMWWVIMGEECVVSVFDKQKNKIKCDSGSNAVAYY